MFRSERQSFIKGFCFKIGPFNFLNQVKTCGTLSALRSKGRLEAPVFCSPPWPLYVQRAESASILLTRSAILLRLSDLRWFD